MDYELIAEGRSAKIDGTTFKVTDFNLDYNIVTLDIELPWGRTRSDVGINANGRNHRFTNYDNPDEYYEFKVTDIVHSYISGYKAKIYGKHHKPAGKGLIFVGSSPIGAKAYIDGKYVGKTPTPVATEVSEGRHTVTCKLDGYDDESKTVDIKANDIKTINISLMELSGPGGGEEVEEGTGGLICLSEPSGAKVYIDGDYKDTTKATIINLEPGWHRVKFRLDGYDTVETSVKVVEGELRNLEKILSPSEEDEPPEHDRSLKLTVDFSRNEVDEGDSVKIFGSLKNSDYRGISGKKITFYDDDLAFDDELKHTTGKIVTATTDTYGNYSVNWKATPHDSRNMEGKTSSVEIYAKFAGDNDYDSAKSDKTAIKVNTSNTYKVYFRSEPAGATVYVDGNKLADKTNDAEMQLAKGSYKATFVLQGKDPVSETFDVPGENGGDVVVKGNFKIENPPIVQAMEDWAASPSELCQFFGIKDATNWNCVQALGVLTTDMMISLNDWSIIFNNYDMYTGKRVEPDNWTYFGAACMFIPFVPGSVAKGTAKSLLKTLKWGDKEVQYSAAGLRLLNVADKEPELRRILDEKMFLVRVVDMETEKFNKLLDMVEKVPNNANKENLLSDISKLIESVPVNKDAAKNLDAYYTNLAKMIGDNRASQVLEGLKHRLPPGGGLRGSVMGMLEDVVAGTRVLKPDDVKRIIQLGQDNPGQMKNLLIQQRGLMRSVAKATAANTPHGHAFNSYIEAVTAFIDRGDKIAAVTDSQIDDAIRGISNMAIDEKWVDKAAQGYDFQKAVVHLMQEMPDQMHNVSPQAWEDYIKFLAEYYGKDTGTQTAAKLAEDCIVRYKKSITSAASNNDDVALKLLQPEQYMSALNEQAKTISKLVYDRTGINAFNGFDDSLNTLADIVEGASDLVATKYQRRSSKKIMGKVSKQMKGLFGWISDNSGNDAYRSVIDSDIFDEAVSSTIRMGEMPVKYNGNVKPLNEIESKLELSVGIEYFLELAKKYGLTDQTLRKYEEMFANIGATIKGKNQLQFPDKVDWNILGKLKLGNAPKISFNLPFVRKTGDEVVDFFEKLNQMEFRAIDPDNAANVYDVMVGRHSQGVFKTLRQRDVDRMIEALETRITLVPLNKYAHDIVLSRKTIVGKSDVGVKKLVGTPEQVAEKPDKYVATVEEMVAEYINHLKTNVRSEDLAKLKGHVIGHYGTSGAKEAAAALANAVVTETNVIKSSEVLAKYLRATKVWSSANAKEKAVLQRTAELLGKAMRGENGLSMRDADDIISTIMKQDGSKVPFEDVIKSDYFKTLTRYMKFDDIFTAMKDIRRSLKSNNVPTTKSMTLLMNQIRKNPNYFIEFTGYGQLDDVVQNAERLANVNGQAERAAGNFFVLLRNISDRRTINPEKHLDQFLDLFTGTGGKWQIPAGENADQALGLFRKALTESDDVLRYLDPNAATGWHREVLALLADMDVGGLRKLAVDTTKTVARNAEPQTADEGIEALEKMSDMQKQLELDMVGDTFDTLVDTLKQNAKIIKDYGFDEQIDAVGKSATDAGRALMIAYSRAISVKKYPEIIKTVDDSLRVSIEVPHFRIKTTSDPILIGDIDNTFNNMMKVFVDDLDEYVKLDTNDMKMIYDNFMRILENRIHKLVSRGLPAGKEIKGLTGETVEYIDHIEPWSPRLIEAAKPLSTIIPPINTFDGLVRHFEDVLEGNEQFVKLTQTQEHKILEEGYENAQKIVSRILPKTGKEEYSKFLQDLLDHGNFKTYGYLKYMEKNPVAKYGDEAAEPLIKRTLSLMGKSGSENELKALFKKLRNSDGTLKDVFSLTKLDEYSDLAYLAQKGFNDLGKIVEKIFSKSIGKDPLRLTATETRVFMNQVPQESIFLDRIGKYDNVNRTLQDLLEFGNYKVYGMIKFGKEAPFTKWPEEARATIITRLSELMQSKATDKESAETLAKELIDGEDVKSLEDIVKLPNYSDLAEQLLGAIKFAHSTDINDYLTAFRAFARADSKGFAADDAAKFTSRFISQFEEVTKYKGDWLALLEDTEFRQAFAAKGTPGTEYLNAYFGLIEPMLKNSEKLNTEEGARLIARVGQELAESATEADPGKIWVVRNALFNTADELRAFDELNSIPLFKGFLKGAGEAAGYVSAKAGELAQYFDNVIEGTTQNGPNEQTLNTLLDLSQNDDTIPDLIKLVSKYGEPENWRNLKNGLKDIPGSDREVIDQGLVQFISMSKKFIDESNTWKLSNKDMDQWIKAIGKSYQTGFKHRNFNEFHEIYNILFDGVEKLNAKTSVLEDFRFNWLKGLLDDVDPSDKASLMKGARLKIRDWIDALLKHKRAHPRAARVGGTGGIGIFLWFLWESTSMGSYFISKAFGIDPGNRKDVARDRYFSAKEAYDICVNLIEFSKSATYEEKKTAMDRFKEELEIYEAYITDEDNVDALKREYVYKALISDLEMLQSEYKRLRNLLPKPFDPGNGTLENVRVNKVIDGDTLEVDIPGQDRLRIRLAGINAPEEPTSNTKEDGSSTNMSVVEYTIDGVQYSSTVDRDFYSQATKYMNKLVGAKTVTLKVNPGDSAETDDTSDSYGRAIAVVIMEDGTDANKKLIEAGLAAYFRRDTWDAENDPVDHEAYIEAMQAAREAQKGIWAPGELGAAGEAIFTANYLTESGEQSKGYTTAEIYDRDMNFLYYTSKSVKRAFSPGVHQVIVVKHGYDNVVKEFNISNDKLTKVHTTFGDTGGETGEGGGTGSGGEEESDIALLDFKAYKVSQGTYTSADVYLDGTYVGQTEKLGYDVVPGSHIVTMKMEGYADWNTTVSVEAGERKLVVGQMEGEGGPDILTGTIDFITDPTGAMIYLDDAYIGTTKESNYVVETGTHTVRFEKSGYFEYETEVVVKENKLSPVNVELIPSGGPGPDAGEVDFISHPTTALIYVDDQYIGTTKKSGHDLDAGEHSVKLTKEGYKDYTGTFLVETGERTVVDVTLQEKGAPAPGEDIGKLDFMTSPSSAMIYVDGEYIGTTKKSGFEVAVGKHTIEFQKDGYQTYSTEVMVEKDKSTPVSAELVEEGESGGEEGQDPVEWSMPSQNTGTRPFWNEPTSTSEWGGTGPDVPESPEKQEEEPWAHFQEPIVIQVLDMVGIKDQQVTAFKEYQKFLTKHLGFDLKFHSMQVNPIKPEDVGGTIELSDPDYLEEHLDKEEVTENNPAIFVILWDPQQNNVDGRSQVNTANELVFDAGVISLPVKDDFAKETGKKSNEDLGVSREGTLILLKSTMDMLSEFYEAEKPDGAPVIDVNLDEKFCEKYYFNNYPMAKCVLQDIKEFEKFGKEIRQDGSEDDMGQE